MFVIVLSSAISYSDADFCLKKELYPILDKHITSIQDSAFVKPADSKWLNLYKSYAEAKHDTLAILTCIEKLALNHNDYDSAINWFALAAVYTYSNPDYQIRVIADSLVNTYTKEADQLLLKVYRDGASEDSLYTAFSQLKSYNSYIDELAKGLADMISTERDDSLAFALTEKFYESFPYSKWRQTVYYFELSHYIGLKDYEGAFDLIDRKAQLSPAHAYLTTIFLLSPTLRRNLNDKPKADSLINKAINLLSNITIGSDTLLVLYDTFTPQHWQARVTLQKVKALYYKLAAKYDFYGDEDSLLYILTPEDVDWQSIHVLQKQISFENNDMGEQAELAFWRGKLYAMLTGNFFMTNAALDFADCLIKGAPRKKYDLDALKYTARIINELKIKTDPLTWLRQLKGYNGIRFQDITESAGFAGNREARVAIGDFNNDSYADILLNGRRLFQNKGNLSFTEMTDTLGLRQLNANGGLFADFNLDGKLDFMTISSDEQGDGERLMKNMGKSFAPVNDRAGEIDDTFPTEGAAWIDAFHDGYPDLYCANYEKWQVRNGFEDRFWLNKKGYFSDKTKQLGFLTPDYTKDPGQAGRGVAPADYDNDGEQEIYVTNYRLDRNFLWDKQDDTYTDIAALNGLQGILKQVYYGHSIGADWGDYDNDGDLDLFVANLAHPRYMDISDKSMLLRNDGKKTRMIEGEQVEYWQFTDVTKQAGITYDELHSDPMWFDADNDGKLDLFITSVYENDRSYLYHNNGDGTFTDVTWLSGCRVYNGWGNAYGDFNHDGKLDLVVGSGNGTKIFLNETDTDNASLILKPIWEKGKVKLIDSYSDRMKKPNSPAYGTRVILTLKRSDGSKFDIIRELSSAKGTTSQSEQILHFGLGNYEVINYKLFKP